MHPIFARRKRALLFCSTVLFGLMIGMAIAECGLRIFAPSWLRNRVDSLNLAEGTRIFGSSVGWSVEKAGGKFVRFVPGTRFQMAFHEWSNKVQIDAWGGRTVNGNESSRTGQFVPFLGDSFTFGLGVEDNQTFVSLLQKDNPRFQYLNLGVPGSSLPHQLDILKFRHTELGSPRVYTFVYFAGNDYDEMITYYQGNSWWSEKRVSSIWIRPPWI